MLGWFHWNNEVLFPTSSMETFFKEAVMADKPQYTLTAGPSREDLFDALRLRHEGKTVTFKGTPTWCPGGGTEGFFIVNSIAAEDGSGHKWLLVVTHASNHKTADAYFDTTTRKGWMHEK
ncbi:MAG: hypothetical protein AAB920_00935 [Patescibacteria group bacterium]|mgnify:CR=1 FL=1